MKKLGKIIQCYLLYALPFAIVTVIWSSSGGITPEASKTVKILWEISSWNFMIWVATLFIFFFLLLFSTSIREQTLRPLANIKERDEREIIVTARASRVAFISTLSLLILLLALSIVTFEVSELPKPVDGKTKVMKIGTGFKLFDEPRKGDPSKKVFLESRDLPLSKTGILLLVLVWQIAVFTFVSRKELRA